MRREPAAAWRHPDWRQPAESSEPGKSLAGLLCASSVSSIVNLGVRSALRSAGFGRHRQTQGLLLALLVSSQLYHSH